MKTKSTKITDRQDKWTLLPLALITFILLNLNVKLYSQVQWNSTLNTGLYSSAIGYQTQSTNNYSFAAGQLSQANGISSMALGNNSTALGNYSVAIGQSSYAALQSYAFGQNAKANGQQSLAIGRFVETSVTGLNSIIIGSSVSTKEMVNNIPGSLMIGFNSTIPTVFVGPSESFSGTGKVGIGTTNPVARLQIADGDIFIQDIDHGIIMKSPDGNCWKGTITNSGQLNFVLLPDCENLTTSTTLYPEISELQVFPNPGTQRVYIYNPFAKAILQFADLSGKMVINLQAEVGEMPINTQNLPAGIYFITLTADNGEKLTQKWIKQ
ncbi:MAG: T9SS type A sorting domain-containing protein [Lentimicrobium sp.]|nr:T9SS type A sorting domain-containing protein [Lentimicrobium sp.]